MISVSTDSNKTKFLPKFLKKYENEFDENCEHG